MRTWRAYLADADPERDRWVLGAEDSAHLTRVLRLRAGDRVGVFDGRGREWDVEIVEPSRAGTVVRPRSERRDRVDPGLEVTLYQGACRSDRFEWILQKGTEIGIARFVPVLSARVESLPRSGRTERWRRILVEACKQCGRRTLPVLAAPCSIASLDDAASDVRVVLEGPEAPPWERAVAGARPRSVALAVGPEGGFEADEREALARSGWLRAALGPRTLRTETAGLVAATLALHAWGDLGSPPDA